MYQSHIACAHADELNELRAAAMFGAADRAFPNVAPREQVAMSAVPSPVIQSTDEKGYSMVSRLKAEKTC